MLAIATTFPFYDVAKQKDKVMRSEMLEHDALYSMLRSPSHGKVFLAL